MNHLERRRAFRDWLSRRGPFVIGVVYGWLLFGYVVEGWVRAFRAFVDVGREWQRDRDFMVRWSLARRASSQGDK